MLTRTVTGMTGTSLVSGEFMSFTIGSVANNSSLPFFQDNNVALGIAVKTFLDEYTDPAFSDEERIKKRSTYARGGSEGKEIDQLPYATNFGEDLSNAFKFFDAIHAAAQVVKPTDLEVWNGAKTYLDARRPPNWDEKTQR